MSHDRPVIAPSGFWDSEKAPTEHVWSPTLAEWIALTLHDYGCLSLIHDFGCGMGSYVNFLRERGFRNVFGYEGDPAKQMHAKGGIFQQDLTKPFSPFMRRGSVICLEVAEHIPAELEDEFLSNIAGACAPQHLLIMSWAVRGQTGHGHVNCLDNHEAIWRVEQWGFTHLPKHSMSARRAMQNDPLFWFKNTLLVFRRG